MLGPLPISVFTHHCSPATISAAGASFLCTVAFSGFRVFTPLVADQSAGGLTPSGMCPQSINDGNWCAPTPDTLPTSTSFLHSNRPLTPEPLFQNLLQGTPNEEAIRKGRTSASLVVQWLRLCFQCMGSILGWRTKIPHTERCSQK